MVMTFNSIFVFASMLGPFSGLPSGLNQMTMLISWWPSLHVLFCPLGLSKIQGLSDSESKYVVSYLKMVLEFGWLAGFLLLFWVQALLLTPLG